MILFIDACVREGSRTRQLAEHLLAGLEGPITAVRLADLSFPEMDEAFINFRIRCTETGDFSDPVFGPAKQFAEADTIVIAAPYWDLSFPAALKRYLEQVCVTGLTFRYTEEGVPEGLCRAKQLWYVTTAGGPIFSDSYGFGYVKTLAQVFYGIRDVRQIRAEGLDLLGADTDAILQKARAEADALLGRESGKKD